MTVKADLYETLGVKPTATPDQVRKAYRKRASEAHPDKGGSDKAMAEVNHAYQVLKTPDRRARYDERGQEDDAPTVEQMAQQCLAELFKEALAAPGRNIVTTAAKTLAGAVLTLSQQEAEARLSLRNLEKRRAKIRVADGVVNVAHALIDEKMAALNRALSDYEVAKQVNRRVTELLKAYADDEQEPTSVFDTRMSRMVMNGA